MTARVVAHVAELWRYPVKSMRGEAVDALDLLHDGIAQDRRYALESSGAPRGKPLLTGRERASMLLQRAAVEDGHVIVTLQDGTRVRADDPRLPAALAALLPQAHTLHLVQSQAPLTDVRPVALLSLQTVAQLSAERGSTVEAARFRANLVLGFSATAGGFPEDALVGRTLQVGPVARLRLTERTPRCRIVTLDPATAEPDPALMKHLDRWHDGRLGVYAVTVAPGPLRVGDAVHVLE